MGNFNFKQISDPVYKTIGLSEIETQIIDTPVFQCLRNIKHLGLVSLVYPGADFSRFDHSLGVCHVTGKVLSALKESGTDISVEEVQEFRLAALLHDIGHYPFSHPMEKAIKKFYSKTFVEPSSEETKNSPSQAYDENKFIDHERVGRAVVESDPDIKEIFKGSPYDPEKIFGIFMGVESSRFANLVKSDLDADRIDYLLRTAHHTGVPYGSVDISYLLGQMVLDGEGRIAVRERSLRAAEHLLLCRYFVYQQNIFHKTVVGFEYLLEEVLHALFEKKMVRFSRKDVEEEISNQNWRNYDDAYLMGKIKELESRPDTDDWMKLKVGSIRPRRPPCLVAEWEMLDDREDKTRNGFERTVRLANEQVRKLKDHFKDQIHESCWHIWHKSRVLTNLASRTGISEQVPEEEKEKSIWLYEPRTKNSKTIMENHRSLMSVMANQVLYSLRIYVLLPEEKKGLRQEIESAIKQDMPEIFDV